MGLSKAIGRQLRAQRKARGWNQIDLVQAVNAARKRRGLHKQISLDTVSRIERGGNMQTVSVEELADALGMAVDVSLHDLRAMSASVRQASVVEGEVPPPNDRTDHPGGFDGSSSSQTLAANDPREPFFTLVDYLHTIAAELEALTNRTALRPVAADRGGSHLVGGTAPARSRAHRKLLPPGQAKTRSAVEPKRRRHA